MIDFFWQKHLLYLVNLLLQNANFCKIKTKHSFLMIVDNFSQFSWFSVDKVDNSFTSPIFSLDCLTICWLIVTDTPYAILYVFLTSSVFVQLLKSGPDLQILIFWQFVFLINQYYKIPFSMHINRFRNLTYFATTKGTETPVP